MRATQEQILKGLVHPDDNVRTLARSYLASPQRRVPGSLEAVIEAAKLYGGNEIVHSESLFRYQPATAETLRWLLDFSAQLARDTAEHLAHCHNPDHHHHHEEQDPAFRFGDVVASWNLDLLAQESDLLNQSDGVSFRALVAIAERQQLKNSPADEIWSEAERFAESLQNAGEVNAQLDRIETLALAMAPHAETLGSKWIDAIQSLEFNDDDFATQRKPTLAEIAIRAAGAAKYRAAAQAMLDLYRKHDELEDTELDDEFLLMACDEELPALADEALFKEVWALARQNPTFEAIGGSLAQVIDSDEAVVECQAFLSEMAVLGNFASIGQELTFDSFAQILDTRVLESLRQIGLHSEENKLRRWSRLQAIFMAMLLETPLAERDAWIAEEEQRRDEERRKPYASQGDSVYYEGYPDIEPSADDDLDDEEGAAPAGPKLKPFRRQVEKVGRNDPCPCGSGKKYKKCCMRKEEAAGI